MNSGLDRRQLIWGIGGSAGLLLLGLSLPGNAQPAPAAARKMTMYKSPTCGCCAKWGAAAEAAGFEVSVVPTRDIHAVKAKLGVPDELVSCHTTVVGGYVVEGHVPLDSVKRLLSQRPNVKGIAVPGMPAGSPGMETPDGRKDDFKVMAFGGAGTIRAF